MSSRPNSPDSKEQPPERFEAARSKKLSKRPISHDCLRGHSFFKDRDPKLFDLLVNHIRVEVFLPGDDIIREGEDGKCMYFLYRGAVAILIGPQLKQVAVLRDGSLFGELALLGNGKRACTVRAVEVCDCRVVGAEAFHTVLRRFPAEKAYFLELAQQRCKELNKDPPPTVEVSQRVAKSRMRRSSNVIQATQKLTAAVGKMRRMSAPVVPALCSENGVNEPSAETYQENKLPARQNTWHSLAALCDEGKVAARQKTWHDISDFAAMLEDGLDEADDDSVQTHGECSKPSFEKGTLSVPCSLFCTPQKSRLAEDSFTEDSSVKTQKSPNPLSSKSITVDLSDFRTMSANPDMDFDELLCRPPVRNLEFEDTPRPGSQKSARQHFNEKRCVNETEFPTLLTSAIHRESLALDRGPRGSASDHAMAAVKEKPRDTRVTTTGDLAAYIMGAKGGRRESLPPTERFETPERCHKKHLPPLSARRASAASSGGGMVFQDEFIGLS